MKGFYRWLKGFIKPPQAEQLGVTRRGFATALFAGLGGGYLLRTHPQFSGKAYNPALIRPPGALAEEEFLAKCIRCGECMKVCITNVLHPAGLEGGPEGFWTPVMRMEIGYCEYQCTLCGQVCPTDAIRELTLEEKQKVSMGLAFFDKNRCLPYAYHRSCIVCEEHCPVPDKAIWTQEVEVTTRRGERIVLKQPHVDPDLCIGCGICHHVCPIKDQPGIYVTSVGESRHPDNKPFLDDGASGFSSGIVSSPSDSASGSDPYGGSGAGSDPYGSSSGSNPYGGSSGSDPYGSSGGVN
jgi:ferredoxin